MQTLKLRCARVGFETLTSEPVALDLDDQALEGGAASVYAGEPYLRIEGDLLGESVREHFDYRYANGALVCARIETTSMLTVMEQSAENPEGRPAFWRADLRVFHDHDVVYETRDEAPAPGHDARDAASTLQMATELLSRYESTRPDAR